MNLGYRFEFSIYSLIHAVLEKVGFTFAQMAAISFLLFFFFIPSAYYSPFHSIYSYCSFTTYIQYRRYTTVLSSLYLTWVESFFSRITSSRRNFLLIIPNPAHPMPFLP